MSRIKWIENDLQGVIVYCIRIHNNRKGLKQKRNVLEMLKGLYNTSETITFNTFYC